MDDDLPYYYWTVNERFLPIQPHFDEVPVGVRRPGVQQAPPQDNDDDSDEEQDDQAHDNSSSDSNDSSSDDDGYNPAAAAAVAVAARHHPQRLHRLRINTREDSAIFAPNRQYLPVQHHRSLREQFHQNNH